MLCGLLILNKPLSTAEPDCSDARWVYLPFDKFIVAGGVKSELAQFSTPMVNPLRMLGTIR